MKNNKLKIKNNQQKLITPCTNCFQPKYIKFNLTYLKVDASIEDKYKSKLFDRMVELSKDSYLVVMNRGKNLSFELIERNKLDYKKQIPAEFTERFDSKTYNNKLAIMRLYPNNNPIVARVIGIIVKQIFYVFDFDIGGKEYSH